MRSPRLFLIEQNKMDLAIFNAIAPVLINEFINQHTPPTSTPRQVSSLHQHTKIVEAAIRGS